jgi:Domain of unknown function (DUF4129)
MQPPAPARASRLAAVAIGLIVLLAIVAFASRAGLGSSHDRTPSTTYLSYAYTAFLVAFVLMIPVAVWAVWVDATTSTRERPSFKRAVVQNVLTFLILCVVIGIALYLHHRHAIFQRPDTTALTRTHDALTHHATKQPKVEPRFEWPVLVIAGVLLAVAAVPLWRERQRWKQRRISKREWEPELASELSDEIGFALDDLRSERDIRRAIIAAYARMERVLDRSGLRRRPSETPFEYLRRVLGDLRVPAEAAQSLTSLFEEAKFSRHELSEDARRRAIGALERVRDDLVPAT